MLEILNAAKKTQKIKKIFYTAEYHHTTWSCAQTRERSTMPHATYDLVHYPCNGYTEVNAFPAAHHEPSKHFALDMKPPYSVGQWAWAKVAAAHRV